MEKKLIMPKQTGQLDVFYASIEIYYESHLRGEEWCENTTFKKEILEKCPRISEETTLNGPNLVKQSELVRYFGFAEYDYGHQSGRAKITERGIRFYAAYKSNDLFKQIDLLMYSILHDTFGRNNTAIQSSNSDVDAPKLFLKACYDMNGITRKELAYLLYITNDDEIGYGDAILELKMQDLEREITIPESLKNKYNDVKFTVFLRDIGIVIERDAKYYLSDYIKNKYEEEIQKLSIYNKEPEIIYSLFLKANEEPLENEDEDKIYQKKVIKSFPYDTETEIFKKANNRVPMTVKVGSKKYQTNPRIGKTALKLAQYKCEINKTDHITFIAKNNKPFMEAHHLIPMHAQKDFTINLDRIENIVCLCPNCHSAIHVGIDSVRYDYLKKLYNLKIEKLKDVGLYISFEDLFSKYYK